MREFHHFIAVDNEQLLFYFSRIQTAGREEFFVSVIRSHKVFSFDMQGDDSEKWKIVTPAPEWLKALEEKLSDAINSNIK
jgi:hypothetical protein